VPSTSWLESVPDRPLAGRRIAVTRPREQGASLAAELERLGARAPLVPLVDVVPLDDPTELDHAVRKLGRYDWIVFTSVNGVAAFRERLPSGVRLGSVNVAAVGPATAAAVRELGVEPAFVPQRFEGAAIADGLGKLEGMRVLVPQGDLASPLLDEELRERGAVVDAVVAYRTAAREPSADELGELDTADAIVLASGSAARSLASLAGRAPGIGTAFHVCIGPRTAEVAREEGLTVDLVADEASADGIIQALTTHFGGSR
jgi:uroporphyrinogen-III synthase